MGRAGNLLGQITGRQARQSSADVVDNPGLLARLNLPPRHFLCFKAAGFRLQITTFDGILTEHIEGSSQRGQLVSALIACDVE